MNIPEKARLGLPEMDEQHYHLYRVFDLLPKENTVRDREKMDSILKEIERYLNFHLTSEEHLMRMYDFPGFAAHQSDHELAAFRLVSYMDDFEAGKLNPGSLRSFLFSWLYEHSMDSDTEYVKWVEKVRKELAESAGG
ncbi:MAG: bacteriohemerythrin [Chitinispirillaceae bacterium]